VLSEVGAAVDSCFEQEKYNPDDECNRDVTPTTAFGSAAPQWRYAFMGVLSNSAEWSFSVTKQMLCHGVCNIPDGGIVLVRQDNNDEVLIRITRLESRESGIPALVINLSPW
jgi:hypothetical protein